MPAANIETYIETYSLRENWVELHLDRGVTIIMKIVLHSSRVGIFNLQQTHWDIITLNRYLQTFRYIIQYKSTYSQLNLEGLWGPGKMAGVAPMMEREQWSQRFAH